MKSNDSIGFSLQQVSSAMSRRSDSVLQEYLSFGYSQYKILSALSEEEAVRQVDIADALDQTEASISRQVKILENEGLLRVNQNKSNRREHLVRISSKGLRKYEKATQILNRLYGPMFRSLSESQLQSLQDSLVIIKSYI